MIKQTLDQDTKSAMLSGDKTLVQVLRTLKSALLDAEIAGNKRDTGLTEPENVAILQKELKKRAEAAALYDQGGNTEQAAAERYESGVIQGYLPKQLTDEEIMKLVDEAVQEYEGELDGRAMGTLIKSVKEKANGAADGATVARLVKAKLQ